MFLPDHTMSLFLGYLNFLVLILSFKHPSCNQIETLKRGYKNQNKKLKTANIARKKNRCH